MSKNTKMEKIGKKVVITAEATIRDEVLKLIIESGARGYTMINVTGGKGVKGEMKEPIIGGKLLTNVRIETITTQEIAEKICDTMVKRYAKHYPCMVYMEDVELIHCKDLEG